MIDKAATPARWLVDTGGSRSDTWSELGNNLFARASHQARRGQHEQAIATLREATDLLTRALGMWPRNATLVRSSLNVHLKCCEFLLALGDDAGCKAELARAHALIERHQPATLENCPLSSTCRELSTFTARRALVTVGAAAALPWMDQALQHHEDAVRFGVPKRVRPAPDTVQRLLRAEILLQLDRADDAVRDLEATGKHLPTGYQQQVPSLVRHRQAQSVAAFLAEHPPR